jgi:hypothetical protein
MSSAWPGSWPVSNPTGARMYVDLWLFAEFCYYQYRDHTETIAQINTKLDAILAAMQGQPGGIPLQPADMSKVNQAVTDLQALENPPA